MLFFLGLRTHAKNICVFHIFHPFLPNYKGTIYKCHIFIIEVFFFERRCDFEVRKVSPGV